MAARTSKLHQHVGELRIIRRLICLLPLWSLVGCGADVGLFDPLNNAPTKTAIEPNDSFAEAMEALTETQTAVRLEGVISAFSDKDVFSLGPLSPGDRVVVDTAASGSLLDVSVALFDDQQRLVYANDDRGGRGSRYLDAYVDWFVRHASDNYYLVVTHSAFAASHSETGSYEAVVSVTAGSTAPMPVQQVVLLDFDGGDVDSLAFEISTVNPFDAGAISPDYEGDTDLVKETIRAVFEQNFARFNVIVITTDDPPPAQGVEVSTVYFGGFSPTTFGIAQDVDLYNVDYCDDAVIFTETFTPELFSTTPTAHELGVAIGNVGAHEAGHLLGLNHVDDDDALMDDQSAADALLADQEFMEAELSSDIMRIGVQDAVLLLDEIVGPTLEAIARGVPKLVPYRGTSTRSLDGRWIVKRTRNPVRAPYVPK